MLGRILSGFPEGYFEVRCEGRRYGVTKTSFAGGRSLKLEARELGGRDHISLNLYGASHGEILKPCEMPAEKVVRFVKGMELLTDRCS